MIDDRHVPTIVLRAYALLAAVAVAVVVRSSDVGLNLWFVDGRMALAVAVAYIGALVAVAARPAAAGAHYAAVGTGVLFWAGRAKAFVDLIVAGDPETGDIRWDLSGAVAERGLLLVSAFSVQLLALTLFHALGHVARLRLALAEARAGSN